MTPRVYLITGAYGGVGEALSHRLSQLGATLYLAGRKPERLLPLATHLNAKPIVLDVTQAEALQEAIQTIEAEAGRLDGVAHCVGSLLLKPAHLTKPQEWTDTIDTNLNSAFYLLRSAVRLMEKSGGGSMVFISSAAARRGLPNHEAIAAAKAGLMGLALSAAATYAPKNIRVNVLAPGLIESPLTAKLLASQQAKQASIQMHALKQLGSPEQVASAAEWLLQPEQCWITGQVLGVDGGLASVQARE